MSGAPHARADASRVAAAAQPDGLVWQVEIDGRPVSDLDDNDPLNLGADEPMVTDLSLVNEGAEPLQVRSLRLQGRVLGMVFFRYTVILDIALEPGQAAERSIELALDDLTGQAVGVLPSELMLLDDDGGVLVEESMTVEVDGSLWSAYGIFGLAVAGMTLVLLGTLLVAVWRSALPANRWTRALQFAGPGVGLGLTLTFTLSATGSLVPDATAWLPIVLLFAAAAFLLGYFLPLGRRVAAAGSVPRQRSEEPATVKRVSS